MSLWTPGGEVPVNRRAEPETSPRSAPPPSTAPDEQALSLDDLTPEQRAQAEAMLAQMAEAQSQIAATPAEQIVATHAAGLYELAAIKLHQDPPMLDDARLAIDALAAVMDQVGSRLGEDGSAIRDALHNIQLAFVQINQRSGGT